MISDITDCSSTMTCSILAVVCFVHRLEGRAQVVERELVRLGEQRVQSSEGTRAMALELCREFEDKFLQHIQTGEVRGFSIMLYISL